MNKTIKILSIVLLVIMIVASTSNVFAFATNLIENLEKETNNAANNVDMGKLPATVAKVIATIRNVSILVGVVIIIILGLKYMMGSVEEKAGYQKSFIPLIVGVVVIMAATSIASFLFNIF